MRKPIVLFILLLISGAAAAGGNEEYQAAQRQAAEKASAEMDRAASQFDRPAPEPTVNERIAQAKACIAHSDALIKRHHEIDREVGFVDSRALYSAGADKVACRHELAAFERCKKTGVCPANVYAASRFRPSAAASAP